MTNTAKVLHYIRVHAPKRVSNSEIRAGTRISPHQQVFQITQALLKAGTIQGKQVGQEWFFWALGERTASHPAAINASPPNDARRENAPGTPLPYTGFEALARDVLSHHYGVVLQPGRIGQVNKTFDLASADGKIVGDAKYYTKVRGERLPPAKFSVIAEHVWLLEKTEAVERFLVFGNDKDVPEQWLKRHGNLVRNVTFYFLNDERLLTRLN
jgi:hypothetical protein